MRNSGVSVADVRFQGRAGAIAAGVIDGGDALALVDPGPASSLAGLRGALDALGRSLDDIRAILVTHVHLDHSGAVGAIVRQHPSVEVYVHERGAPHLVDPSRLLASAERLYGAEMNRLWGEVAPVPDTRVRVLTGGERLAVTGRTVRVAYTPGHATHHVSYFDEPSRVAFTGDVGGMSIGDTRYAIPPTPPPDIDLEAWDQSVERIAAWKPEALFVAHFGLVADPARHLADLVVRLHWMSDVVRETLELEGGDAERTEAFRRRVAELLRRDLSEHDAGAIERAAVLDDSWRGLARYWRKRGDLRRP